MEGLKQKEMDVQRYTKEFNKLDIRVAHKEDAEDKVARYIGGLRYTIQDEFSLSTPRNVEEYYKLAMKAEDKIKRRQERQGSSNKGRGRGKRPSNSNEQKQNSDKGKEPVFEQKWRL